MQHVSEALPRWRGYRTPQSLALVHCAVLLLGLLPCAADVAEAQACVDTDDIMSTNGAESASSLEMSLLQVGLEVQGANAHKLATMSVHEMMDESQVHKKRSALHA